MAVPLPQTPPAAPPTPTPEPAVDDYAARLAALTPTFPAPFLDVLAAPGSDLAAVRLLGVDLIQDGRKLSTGDPLITGESNLRISAYWRSNLQLASRLALTIKFASYDGKIVRTQKFSVGPVKGEAAWIPGVVYTQDYDVDASAVAAAFSGRCDLSLNVPAPPAEGQALAPLQSVAVKIRPVVGIRKLAADRLRELFGANCMDLSTSFRLGGGADIEVPARAGDKPVQAIGLISAYSYGAIPQGEPVCEIMVIPTEGSPQTLRVESGVNTARMDYDYQPSGHYNHQKILIAESMEADYLNTAGAPFQKHKYAAILPLAKPIKAIKALQFRMNRDIILDVFDVALLPEIPPPSTSPAP